MLGLESLMPESEKSANALFQFNTKKFANILLHFKPCIFTPLYSGQEMSDKIY